MNKSRIRAMSFLGGCVAAVGITAMVSIAVVACSPRPAQAGGEIAAVKISETPGGCAVYWIKDPNTNNDVYITTVYGERTCSVAVQ
ncbi:hypothetical protein BAJUN_01050 [Bajunvirus bajun]|uniref:Lipoprotein n=1 Tax=Brevundimonas phage vB_BgoS-Bajun TaxID=2948594 RepID=A0A9E7SU33_9CAUD|nr:hypothetical protein BAJUN_01050 [Brevundimonas phage vB_BgoS-Bajun]